jgi:hypothetical protein
MIQIGKYNIFSTLKPNIIYNYTEYKFGDGLLYQSISEIIYIKFVYNMAQSEEVTDTKIDYELKINFESPNRWVKNLTQIEMEKYFILNNGLNFSLSYNSTKMLKIFEILEKEVALKTLNQDIIIIPKISLTGKINGTIIHEIFEPILKISYITDTYKGSYISFSEIENQKITQITKKIGYQNQELETQKLSYISLTIITATLLCINIYFLYKNKPKINKEEEYKKIDKKYRDLISCTSELPTTEVNTIPVNNFEDLVKISERLQKPIISTIHEATHLYYVSDEKIRYTYSTPHKNLN